jgi:hypothetical protein
MSCIQGQSLTSCMDVASVPPPLLGVVAIFGKYVACVLNRLKRRPDTLLMGLTISETWSGVL